MEYVILIGMAFLVGGILKGAIGAGAPLAAVPLLSLIYGVSFAVAVFVAPNLVSNLIQGWQFRKNQPPGAFVWLFAITGALGALAGTFFLVALPQESLKIGVACVILLYLLFRFFRPTAKIDLHPALWLTPFAGFIGGILQGASGVSAPVSVTFLSLIRLTREQFIASISLFFLAMGLVQLPALIALGIMDIRTGVLSCLSVLPLLLGMRVGEFIITRLDRQWFDRSVMMVLGLMAVLLLINAGYGFAAN